MAAQSLGELRVFFKECIVHPLADRIACSPVHLFIHIHLTTGRFAKSALRWGITRIVVLAALLSIISRRFMPPPLGVNREPSRFSGGGCVRAG